MDEDKNSKTSPFRDITEEKLQETITEPPISNIEIRTHINQEAQVELPEKAIPREEIAKTFKGSEPKIQFERVNTTQELEGTNHNLTEARCLEKSTSKPIINNVDVNAQNFSNNQTKVAPKP